jgi:lipopolysaccharide export system permease protein
VDDENGVIKGIIIHDNSDKRQRKIVTAEWGELVFDHETERMNFILYNGEIHEVDNQSLENYRRMQFEKHQISIPVSNMVLKRSQSSYRGDREKDLAMMQEDIEKNLRAVEDRRERIRNIVNSELNTTFPRILWGDTTSTHQKAGEFKRRQKWTGIQRIKALKGQIEGEARVIRGLFRSVSALMVEKHKKRSVPFACIVFVLIGAPLGIMVRRGGFAMGGVLSLIFFLIYWTFLIGGEQLADRHYIFPGFAM